MKKHTRCIVSSLVILFIGFIPVKAVETSNDSISYEVNMKQDILCLMMGYPEYVKGVECTDDNKVYVVLSSGKKIIYDDKISKNFQQKMDNPDIQDMMEQLYPLSDIKSLREKEFNPGRIRIYPLLKEAYGSTRGNIEKNLTNVKVGYKNFQFNKKNNAATSLKNAMKDISTISKGQEKIFPANGTFNYRVIAGTNRLSPHSFGTAIDLKSDKKDYWKWASREQGQKRLDSYPREVVEIFEKNNFIWGGKWGKFDILHFEYRPELILKARYFGNKSNSELWYDGVPYDNNNIKEYISIIDKAFK